MRKQLIELFQTYFVDRKTGRARSRAASLRLVVLAVVLFAGLGWVFFNVSTGLGVALLGNCVDWLYFAIMALMAIAFGVFGSVFNTYASLYLPKDNEQLLALPIPAHALVLSRVAGVFATSLLYSAWIWIPTVLAYFALAATGAVGVPVTVAGVLSCVVLTFVLALFVTVLSCVVGWVVALIASRVKNKAFLTVLCSLLVVGLYWLAYFRLVDVLNNVVEYIAEMGAAVQTWLHYSWLFGMAAQGDLLALLEVVAITAMLAIACLFVLVKSFAGLATSTGTTHVKERGGRKAKAHRPTSPRLALLKREFSHFTSSPTWMLNCGFGLLLLPVAGVAALVMRDALHSELAAIAVDAPEFEPLLPLLLFVALAAVVSVNAITCASVSLEGKSIWAAQSLPIDPWETLRAKANMAALLNAAAVLFAAIAIGIALGFDAWAIALVSAASVLYSWLHAYLGLTFDLRNANLNWTDDTVPVKRSMSTLLSWLVGWALCCVMALAGFFLEGIVGCAPTFIGLIALVAVLAAALRTWLKTRGAAQFAIL